MIIKVGDEYLEFTGDIVIEKQLFSFATLTTAGTFSYSFTVEPTAQNRRLLNVLNISNNENACLVENVQIQTDGGITLFIGYINVDNSIGIDCSFFSDNNNFFSKITGKCIDLDLSAYDIETREDTIISSWSNNTGVVWPLVDIGVLKSRSDYFLQCDFNQRVNAFETPGQGTIVKNEFQPFLFVKHIVNAIMSKAGLTISGDLLKDANYNNLITTNNSQKKLEVIANQNISVASKIPQTVANITPTKLSFELVNTSPQYQSKLNNWDTSINRFTATYQCVIHVEFTASVSDISKETHFHFDVNGVNRYNAFVNGTTPNPIKYAGYLFMKAGDYFEMFSFVDSGPGTNDINTATLKISAVATDFVFASTLCPNANSVDFLSDIFKMFNVIANYDPYSKVVNTVLYKDVTSYPEQDLSEYIHNINELSNYNLISNYGQINTIGYKAADNDLIKNYNDSHVLQWGQGSFDVNNRSLKKLKEFTSLDFIAPYCYRNDLFKTFLVEADYLTIEDSEATYAITSVTNSGGLAVFHTSGGNFTFFNIPYAGNATGTLTLQQYKLNTSDDQIVALYFPDVTLPQKIRFSVGGDNSVVPPVGSVDPMRSSCWKISDSTIINYNGQWQLFNNGIDTWPEVYRENVGVAVFVKSKDGSELDIVRQGLSFGDIDGFDSLNMTDTYYGATRDSLNNPINPIVEFLLPEQVFLNLDLTKPIRLKTEKFNSLFIANKLTGYKDSVTPCILELVKITK